MDFIQHKDADVINAPDECDEWQQRAEAAERERDALKPLAELGRLVEAMPDNSILMHYTNDETKPWSVILNVTGFDIRHSGAGSEETDTPATALRAALGEAAQPEQPEAA